MSQMPLFSGTSESVLVDDERGRVVYTPGVLPAEVARAWFAELRESVPWKTQRRRMYDREVDVPRLMAHFRLEPEERGAPDAIREAARKVIAVTGVPFNSVGLNFYRDGRDSVAPHNDHLDGATRRMTIRATEPPRRVLQIDLTAGSLLVMSYETQLHYTHGIPKTREPVGARISLASPRGRRKTRSSSARAPVRWTSAAPSRPIRSRGTGSMRAATAPRREQYYEQQYYEQLE